MLPQRWKCKTLLKTALEWQACLGWKLLWVNGWVWPEERGGLLIISMDFTLCAFKLSFYFYSTCLLTPIYKTIYIRGIKVSLAILRRAESFLSNVFTTGVTFLPQISIVKVLPVLKCWDPNSEHFGQSLVETHGAGISSLYCWKWYHCIVGKSTIGFSHQPCAEEGALGQRPCLRQD